MKKLILKRITAAFMALIVTASSSFMPASAEDAGSGLKKYYKFLYLSGVELNLDGLMPPAKPDDYLKESLQTIQQIGNSELSGKYQDMLKNGLESTVNWFTKT